MPVIARDAVASDHLVFAWPFPIGPEEFEVSCAEDELVVMCPSFMVGDRLGPGRHRWRTPDPMRPVSAYFVLTAPVEVSFDMITQFVMPNSGQPVRVRAVGSMQVRCMDPGLLVAQFVGLPFDAVNDGVLRSVSRSMERMLARLLTRRVVMAGTPNAVTDPQMLPSIVEELIAYNPAAGAVFGVELVRMGHVSIMADDGSRPWQTMTNMTSSGSHQRLPTNGGRAADRDMLETVRGPRPADMPNIPTRPTERGIEPLKPAPAPPPAASPKQRPQSQPQLEASGEIVVKPREKTTAPGHAAAPAQGNLPAAPEEIVPDPHRVITTPVPPRRAGPIDVPRSEETPPPELAAKKALEKPKEGAGAIMGIGMNPIGSGSTNSGNSQGGTAAGEIGNKIPPGGRVLVQGPNGLMQAATVRQLLQGYYELEVGGSGETIWVPMNTVVPD